MSFEERLRRLTERQDALLRGLQSNAAMPSEHSAANRELDRRMREIREAIERLVQIAEKRTE